MTPTTMVRAASAYQVRAPWAHRPGTSAYSVEPERALKPTVQRMPVL
ncbi:hypothetical protein [Streptomyces atrovirens]|uniref:Uncharacterized protein n=1 Tax=Streptomyces atrovirens TaxID=285556 RepID=A0ABW0DWI8_9ACTN